MKFEPFWTNTHKQTAVPGSALCDTEQSIKNLLAIRGEAGDMFFLFLPSFCHHFLEEDRNKHKCWCSARTLFDRTILGEERSESACVHLTSVGTTVNNMQTLIVTQRFITRL